MTVQELMFELDFVPDKSMQVYVADEESSLSGAEPMLVEHIDREGKSSLVIFPLGPKADDQILVSNPPKPKIKFKFLRRR